MKTLLLFAISALAGAAFAADAPRPVKPTNRADAQKIVAGLRRVVTPNGVDRIEKIKLGGIDQWITIRGNDQRNPVLLYLHGGPGYVVMPLAWWQQRSWEEYFTVVNWDQRGAGKTYNASDPAVVSPTMSVDRMLKDTEELITFLRKDLRQDKIFVLGHSWGSVLGLEMARRHPEWLHAYIGMGQATDMLESERRGYAYALASARKENNAAAIKDLEAIAPYAVDKPPATNALLVQRKWLGHYDGVLFRRENADEISAGANLSPDYTDQDIRNVWVANSFSVQRVFPEIWTHGDFSGVDELKCPLLLFEGRHDYNVSSSVAAEWFERLKAPHKKLVWFEDSAHEPQAEEPGHMLLALVTEALPIAKPELATR